MQSFADNILDWYDQSRRHLPWRADPGVAADPYRVWLSEIMLQQTTVEAVKPYFQTFTRRWPNVSALADAPLDDVLAAWAGLGYYARARNLHKCAGVVRDSFGGIFPDTETILRTLPGIGDYTAAAIAAIAFEEAVAVVDGNIERIISRVAEIDTPLPKAKSEIKAALKPLVPDARPGDFAQAMMDIGATICRPRQADCLLCPVQQNCAARASGRQLAFPVKPAKKPKPVRRITAFLPVRGDTVLLERRAETGLLGGMPGFFSTPWVERETPPSPAEARNHMPFDADWRPLNATSTHVFTHFQLETQIWTAAMDPDADYGLPEGGYWAALTTPKAMGLPTVFAKMLKLLGS